ncbi:MAG: macro domain-containing protein [Opitutales bacterium]
MIEYTKGNLLEDQAEALVNTVNCVGVMGKGIALQFRQAFPECFADYKQACDAGEIKPGYLHVHETGNFLGPRFIVNFPTKRHWKGKSKIEDITAGLDALRSWIEETGIRSIALPPLGCGNGGLAWNVVRKLIEQKLAGLDDVSIRVFEPVGAPESKAMSVATKRPNMTRGRAALLAVFREYLIPGYELSMLEIQKLAYFLQEVGEPLKLNFEKQKYGPYAETLHHVLQRIEGHFIRGYGDRSRDACVEVYEDAMRQAQETLEQEYPETLQRAEHVKDMIEGFETPYGLELLSSVHWVIQHEPEASVEKTVDAVHSWNQRKAQLFPEKHIRIAWNRILSTPKN